MAFAEIGDSHGVGRQPLRTGSYAPWSLGLLGRKAHKACGERLLQPGATVIESRASLSQGEGRRARSRRAPLAGPALTWEIVRASAAVTPNGCLDPFRC
jgi:hypothetical protein